MPAWLATLVLAATAVAEPLHFVLTHDGELTDSYTGRVYVMLSATGREPRVGPNWMMPEPFFAIDVVDWEPEVRLHVDAGSLGFPDAITELPEQVWRAQAVMRLNLDSPSIGTGEGTGISEVLEKKFGGADGGAVFLHIDQRVEPARSVPDGVRVIRLRSDLLSDFHGRPVHLEAAVRVPPHHEQDHEREPDRRYPALYIIPGFGGDHLGALRFATRIQSEFDDDIVKIGLNGSCRTGHHVFADSANNGPWGRALVEELIPHLERELPLASTPSARFLTGGSSGGWASLWLQITHPDFFGGTWSLVPDPVDFRSFQLVNLYAPNANVYRDIDGTRIPVARFGTGMKLWYDDFAAMEVVQGEGGQLYSFDAVFSPRGRDGKPMQYFDRVTGDVNPDVVEAWKAYDIRLVLAENWDTLGPKLAGKINVIAGEDDNFYLEDAVKRLGEWLADRGSDAVIEVRPGKNHMTTADRELLLRIDRELLEIFATTGVAASRDR